MPCFDNKPNNRGTMFWEHEGNAAARAGKWKLVRNFPGDWELYNMDADRTETDDLAAEEPDRVAAMKAEYEAWAARCGVVPREKFLEAQKRKREESEAE